MHFRHLLGAVMAALLLAPFALVPALHDPAPAAAQVADRPLLRLGDSGPSVAAWQRQLRIATGANIAVDGSYGTPTEQATANFQRFFGLRVDGIVGENTRNVMRYVLAVNHGAYELASNLHGTGLRVVGYQGEQGYCLEVQDGDQVAVECAQSSSAPIGAQLIDLGGRTVLLGTTDRVINSMEVETDDGATHAVPLVDPPRFDRKVWMTGAMPSEVSVVRALAADGSEVRSVVIEDSSSYLILERGDRGPRVQQWQRQLDLVTGAGLATDGVFGSSTVAATRNFQAFFDLRVDGIVGPETRSVMQYILAIRGTPSEPPDEETPEGAIGEPTTGESDSGDFPSPGSPVSYVTDVRVGDREGFDRVVFEFSGDQVPSWRVEPAGPPIRQQPSSLPLQVSGDEFLEVSMAPASGVDLTGAQPRYTYTGPQRIALEGAYVTEIVQSSDFENHTSWVLGLRDDVTYGVAELSDPARLVIDIY